MLGLEPRVWGLGLGLRRLGVGFQLGCLKASWEVAAGDVTGVLATLLIPTEESHLALEAPRKHA